MKDAQVRIVDARKVDAYKMMYTPGVTAHYILAALFGVHKEELPRFRNAWIEKGEGKIFLVVLARVGKKYHGKKSKYDETVYMNHRHFEKFVDGWNGNIQGKTFCDDTFGKYYFNVPPEWEYDFYLMLSSRKFEGLSAPFQIKFKQFYSHMVPMAMKHDVELQTEKTAHEKMNEDAFGEEAYQKFMSRSKIYDL